MLSEHWLYDHETSYLLSFHPEYLAITRSSPVKESWSYLLPRNTRGHGGVAILWHRSFDKYITIVKHPVSEQMLGILIDTGLLCLLIVSVYLPTRSGCTANYVECLDSCFSVYPVYPGVHLLFGGDFNTDPGPAGGPFSTTHANEQGRILKRYLGRWQFTSAHLNFPGLLHHSEAHNSLSTIDHFLCSSDLLQLASSSHTTPSAPLDLSDHSPVFLTLNLPISQFSYPVNITKSSRMSFKRHLL